ncbi:abscisic acid receptor PYR1 [Striga asiatica]|uniref:Abscisic acid receptor PYR1 n=1 Tax=Striga asiatica TaxID=4170 RepID=A0A5A7RA72_STRAF|nr:abscisic acid receptor PYR1 [Striga asiatica]
MTSSFIYKERMKALYHTNPMVPNRCSLMLTRSIDARLPVVWWARSVREVMVAIGLPARRSTELLERLDDDRPVIVVRIHERATIDSARHSFSEKNPAYGTLARWGLVHSSCMLSSFCVVSVGDLVGNSGGARGFVCFGGPLGFFLDEEDGGVNAVGWDFLLPRRRGLRESRRMRIWGFVICGGIRVSGRRI